MDELRKMIEETKRWLDLHRREHRPIEAAACMVRLNALKAAMQAIRAELEEQR